MKLIISSDYRANVNTGLLGYTGEANARTIEVEQPEVDGADTYRLRFDYGNNTIYDVPIEDGKILITGSLLPKAGQVKCQWLATAAEGESYKLVAKSNIFALRIGDSISNDITPVPSYEQSVEAMDKVLAYESSAAEYAEQAQQSVSLAEDCKTDVQSLKTEVETLYAESQKSAEAAAQSEQSAENHADNAAESATAAALSAETAQTAKTEIETLKGATESAAESAAESAQFVEQTAQDFISDLNETKTELQETIDSAETEMDNLNDVISQANSAGTELLEKIEKTETAISNASTARAELQTVIDNSETVTGEISAAVTAADTAKSGLDGLVTVANRVLQCLTDENTSAESNLEELKSENFKADEILTGVEDIKAYLGYTDEDIVGLQVDYQNKVFKRLAGAVGKESGTDFDVFPMYGGRKRCNVSDDGTIVAWYGDEGYAEDGSNGQVMVYQPAFYYKVVPLKTEPITDGTGYHLRKANYYVSAKPKVGFKLHPAFYNESGSPVDYILLSAYEGSMYDVSTGEYVNDGTNTETAIETGDLLCSVAGKKPISGLKKNLNKTNLEQMAQNRSPGWHLETIKITSANQLLMIIELGTMNTQTAIGQGVVSIAGNSTDNCASLTGSTSTLGNGTGSAEETINEIGGAETPYTAAGKVSVSYRGEENPWGNIWKHIQGINIWGNGTMGGGQLYVSSDFNFSESKNSDNYEEVGFTLPNAGGYISAMGYGSEKYDWLFMPSEIGGTSALPVGDNIYASANLNDNHSVQLGGYYSSGAAAGGFFWHCVNADGNRSRIIGGRLVYVPQAT